MMVIFWAITPLTSSIFATARVTQVTSATASTTSSLLPLDSQYSALTAGFLMTAYGIVWLEQALPGFTTHQGALVPFVVESDEREPSMNVTWTSTTEMFKTTLECHPANITNSTLGVSYSNGKGCVVEGLSSPATSDPTALYIGWHMNNRIDYALSRMGCSSDSFSHLFLAYFSQGQDSTAIFCEPAYWVQHVNATIKAADMSTSEIVPLRNLEPLPDAAFNVSDFEYLLGTGGGISAQRADVSDSTAGIYQGPRLLDISITGDTTNGNMVGYALGLTRLTPSAYLSPDTLASSFGKAHQLLFALAIGTLLSGNSPTSSPRPGHIQGPAEAILVVRTLALLVEAFLGLMTILIVALLYISWVRPSQLRHDPASLKDVINMVRSDSPTPAMVEASKGSDEALYASVTHGKFRFGVSRAVDNHLGPEQECAGAMPKSSLFKVSNTQPPLVRPLELRLVVAAMFIAILSLAVTTLIVLHIKTSNELGLPLPSKNRVVNQLLTNYLPVAFATFIEPFWLLLNRALCILRPFEELRLGNVQPSKSLNLKYTSLPPQLVIFRALRAEHLLLAAVCAIGLSANILSVALGGIFKTDFTMLRLSAVFKPQYSPVFDRMTRLRYSGEKSSDPSAYYIAKANISDGTSLPPWLSQDRFFMPVLTDFPSLDPSARAVKATTQAFGTELNCAAIDYDSARYIKSSALYGYDPDRAQVVVPQGLTEGHKVVCNSTILGPHGGQNNSKAAMEVIGQLGAALPGVDDLCTSLLLIGFLRANLTISVDNFSTDYTDQPMNYDPDIIAINSLSSLWMVCQPTLITAPYSITVDRSGRVQEYDQVGPDASSLEPFFAGDATVGSLFNETGYFWDHVTNTRAYWHNDTFVDTWFAYFIKHLTNSTIFVDPTQPVPAFGAIEPVIKDIFSRIFPILLSLNTHWFGEPRSDAIINGAILKTQNRIFLAQPAYIITMTLLGLNLLVAFAYYAKRPKRMLQSLPTTIASVLELFDGSGLVGEISEGNGMKEEWKVGYGRFVGTDGKPRVGIERRPFVVPWANGP